MNSPISRGKLPSIAKNQVQVISAEGKLKRGRIKMLTMRLSGISGVIGLVFCSQRRNDLLCVVRSRRSAVWLGVAGLLLWGSVENALGQVDWKREWERSLQETKREGEIV